jgi:hypothetical protein
MRAVDTVHDAFMFATTTSYLPFQSLGKLGSWNRQQRIFFGERREELMPCMTHLCIPFLLSATCASTPLDPSRECISSSREAKLGGSWVGINDGS